VAGEQEYVMALTYVAENYFPEMERRGLPQELRGKRGVVFGNLEKLRAFHEHCFLREMEGCLSHPQRLAQCFLRYRDQFGLYALYAKNKPKSDALMASYGNAFFKRRQEELGDSMDLASYLQKPLQRLNTYAQILEDMLGECGQENPQDLCLLQAAAEMVRFQLRHGNDLLMVDAIQGCDVNLKEQGHLIHKDEFTIWYGRKKFVRHVFLFEELVLFSKAKHTDGKADSYTYKHSFKTADIGLTENIGDSGLRFEIWFRKRKSKESYILQASSPDVKQAWTKDIAQLLWHQAMRNKDTEVRIQEMVSMGIGNKPFLDIKASDDPISDRTVDYFLTGRGSRTRASVAVSSFNHTGLFRSPSSSSSIHAHTSSSSSMLGSLNLHTFSTRYLAAGMVGCAHPFEDCIEEELEFDTSSQPSVVTQSSGSS
uniref:Pleckstrin homology and RhoGEF domain containing G4B n=1 Tax=Latimeria chalumnae TaxID=7897 RepID=H3AC90_LATCH